MEITSDVLLRGSEWHDTIDGLKNIITTKTHYSIFILCLTIGVMRDQRQVIDAVEPEPKTVPRNVMQNSDSGKLDLIFQTAVLTSKTITLSEEERLELAFGDSPKIDKLGCSSKLSFLTEFANAGVMILHQLIDPNEIITMENIKDYLETTISQSSLSLDELYEESLDFDF